MPASSLDGADWGPVDIWLDAPERSALRDAVLAVRRASTAPSRDDRR